MSNIDFNAMQDLSKSDVSTLLNALQPKVTKYIVHKPYVKQQVFMWLQCKEAFYGGAAGGGKSDALLMCALQYVDVPGYSAIIFRKTFADLVKPGALIDRAREWLAPWTKTKEVRWVDKEKKFVFPSGAILQFGYLDNPNARFNYQGGEYQFIGFDEVTHIDQVCYKYLFSRLRKLEAMDVPLRVRAASNPPDDGDDAEWVYDRFVNEKTKKPHVVFIAAGLDDNPYLDKESYLSSLNELDPVTRARLRDGVWTITRKGNMFKRDWFEFVDVPPAHRRIVRYWDCAGTDPTKKKNKKSSDPDWTVGFKLSEAHGIYYIEDICRVQKTPHGVEEEQYTTALTDGRRVAIFEEQEPGSSGIATIDFKARGLLKGRNYRGIRSSGSKVTRADAASAAAERGHIKIVRNCRNIMAFFDEAEAFPGGVHDDMVDGLSGAFNALGSTVPDSAPETASNEDGSYWDGDSLQESASSGTSYWRQ